MMKAKFRIAAAVLAAGLVTAPAVMVAQGPPPPPPMGYGQGPGGWDAPPPEFTRDVQRNGFRDGINGAQRDFENHRPPNVMNRDEYRNYRGPERRVYRSSFQRGYNLWWSHQGGPRGPRPY